MKRIIALFLVIALVLVGTTNVFATKNTNVKKFTADELADFSINNLDDSMTLAAALEEYPIIKEIYYVGMSDTEAKAMCIDISKKPEKTINAASDINAKEYLLYLNAMRPEAVKAKKDKGQELSLLSQKVVDPISKPVQVLLTSYGVAWAYVSNTSTGTNCYAYALGGTGFYNPGDFAYYYGAPYSTSTTVSDVVNYMKADATRDGKTARSITSATSTINSNEYRIVTRVGYHNVSGIGWTWDYHWMRQTSSGGWCHKPGQTPSVNLGSINPSTYSWNLGTLYTNFYDSATKYIATPKLSTCNY